MKVVLVGLVVASLIVTVSAHGFGHRQYAGVVSPKLVSCWYYYNTSTTISYDEIQQQAEDMLNGASVIAIKNRWGYTRYIIVKDGIAIGVLWQNADLNSLEIGEQLFVTPWFVKVPLIYNGQVVGMLRVPLNTS